MPSDDWCAIYVQGVADRGALARLVADAVGGAVDGELTTLVHAAGVEIDVTGNSYNERFEAAPPDENDFLFWPHIVGMEVDEALGVPLATSILRALWASGASAVAACDFEERLPRSGGWRDGRLIVTDGD